MDINTLLVELNVCIHSKDLPRGMTIHLNAAANNNDVNISVASTLVRMYVACGSMVDAQKIFDQMRHRDAVTWNTLMLGYAENGEGEMALNLFTRMRIEGCKPDARSCIAALKACTRMKTRSLETGMAIHFQAASLGCACDIFVACTLVDMYGKFGNMKNARRVFNNMKHRDVIVWTALIMGYVENGEGRNALECFSDMRSQGCVPNYLTFLGALKACGMLGALELGKGIHAELALETGHDRGHDVLASTLIDFYCKCGSITDAQEVFDSLQTKDIVTWTSLMAGYSRAGETECVFEMFHNMRGAGLQPDGVAFLCLLTACSHSGLVNKAREYLELMWSKYGITPGVDHLCCIVDTLGRANKLDDALEIVKSMPFEADGATWTAVLAASRKWKNVEVGRLAFGNLQQCQGQTDATTYIEMSNTLKDIT